MIEGLGVLNLTANRLNGYVPGFVARLRRVYVSFNRFVGVISKDIGEDYGRLEHLDLAGNYLVQGIPSSLGNCSRLRTLLLYLNILDGSVLGEIGNLKSLQVLDVSMNTLICPVPRELGNCSKLTVLVLSNLFDLIGNFDNALLIIVNYELNYFEGALPIEIALLPKLRILWAPMVNLEDNFLISWGVCGSLEMVNLAQNYFSGEFPKQLGLCKKLHFLDLSSKNLTGELFEELHVPCMTVFDVSGNMLSGLIPEFSNDVCPLVPSWNGNLFKANVPPPYASFFSSKVCDITLFHL